MGKTYRREKSWDDYNPEWGKKRKNNNRNKFIQRNKEREVKENIHLSNIVFDDTSMSDEEYIVVRS